MIEGGSDRGIYKLGTGSLGMTNCLIHSQPDHGVQADAGTVTIGNSTLADNGGWGLTNTSATLTIKNSIVWGNSAGGISPTNGTITYTCSQETHVGDGNTNSDPLFENTGADDFHLRLGSPCINKGQNESWMNGATDLDGNARRQRSIVDMGCYESSYGGGTVFMVM